MPDLASLMKKLGYTFQNPRLLEQALTHSSYANEKPGAGGSNERLEFLGDSVLGFIAASHLYEHDSGNEGSLSKRRAAIVCEQALASYSREIGVGDFLRLGKGERATGGADRDSNLEDAFEAIVGAIYLDGGLPAAAAFALPYLERELGSRKEKHFKDYKTMLQEIVQQNPEESLRYELVAETGPDHNKHFIVEVHLSGNVIGRGKGTSKKEAEQRAAQEALALMGY